MNELGVLLRAVRGQTGDPFEVVVLTVTFGDRTVPGGWRIAVLLIVLQTPYTRYKQGQST